MTCTTKKSREAHKQTKEKTYKHGLKPLNTFNACILHTVRRPEPLMKKNEQKCSKDQSLLNKRNQEHRDALVAVRINDRRKN